MTIQQLQYVLEISKTGSVSKAAKNLYMSQPNISNALKNLEQELGITVFERTPMGMRLTPAGRRLVQKAESIMTDIREITTAQTGEEPLSFRLVYPRYVPAFDAFTQLCRSHQDHPHLQFSGFIGDGAGDRQVETLYHNRCDMMVYLDKLTPAFRHLCADMHVEIIPLMECRFYVQLSENHPLLKEGPFHIDKLKQYPYVAFANLNDWNAAWMPWSSLVNPEKIICVHSTSSRVNMVAATNAFSIVVRHSDRYNREHHVVQIPFESETIQLACLYSADRGLSELGAEYLKLLKDQISAL